MKRILFLLIIIALTSCNYKLVSTNGEKNPCDEIKTVIKQKELTYPELLEKVNEYETKHRKDFVETKTNYRKQLFSSKLTYIFNITNNAKVATFKDAKFLVKVIAETGTVIKTDTVYAYKFFPPGQTIQYKYTTQNIYKDRVTADIKYLGISPEKYKR